MPTVSASSLEEATGRAETQYFRLILLVGPPLAGKTAALQELADTKDYPLLNVNLALCKRMLDLTRSQRARQVERLFKELLAGTAGEVILLDNLEILFDTALEIDPLRLLQVASRNRTTVAAWNGGFCNGVLSYAEPGHPEYQTFRQPDAVVVVMQQGS